MESGGCRAILFHRGFPVMPGVWLRTKVLFSALQAPALHISMTHWMADLGLFLVFREQRVILVYNIECAHGKNEFTSVNIGLSDKDT